MWKWRGLVGRFGLLRVFVKRVGVLVDWKGLSLFCDLFVIKLFNKCGS